ncbi:MAG: tRNA uridine-5-carboxymethylaminomethyl(34) synthesis GTPase MnmE [Deltaproteobacteria bacterium]|nr:tRNA uridine-5-carboxymethylaminomethyl(34) synthesis GTPase MnmE [Deltaproteobacteria bacterium]
MSASILLKDTIAALATPIGEAGIAVVRVSGPLASKILFTLFKTVLKSDEWQSHRLYYGELFDSSNKILDYAMAVWMKGPCSFTGEDVVEFHIHGGQYIALKTLEAIFTEGARSAKPGEFSERAFLNGKIDLTQAESIADMISANSELSLRLAQRQWQGAFSKPVAVLRELLLECLVRLETAVDFPEDDLDFLDRPKLKKIFWEALQQITCWIVDYEKGKILREGLRVVLLGKPNVGKSSLLNQLVQEDAAIVHSQAGTTRDPIHKNIVLAGLTIQLIDTAGLRNSAGEIEKIGIERSLAWFEKADLVLAMFDLSSPLDNDDLKLLSLLGSKPVLLIYNKKDLRPQWDPHLLYEHFNLKRPVQIKSLLISAKNAEGIRELEKIIPELFGLSDFKRKEQFFINQIRHCEALNKAKVSLEMASRALDSAASPELIASDVLMAIQYLGEIIGKINTEDILDSIFSKFCIGK